MTQPHEPEHALAARSDATLVAYQAKWERKLRRLQRAHPERWRVAGLSDDEVRDALTLRLLEVVRGGHELVASFERADKEFGLCVVEQQLAALRRRFRVEATPMDFSDAPLLERPASQEQRLLEAETDALRALATESALGLLNQPQRRWLSAMKLAAYSGEFFQESDELNLSAAARLLGRHRSSALRAYQELQTRFQHALDSLD